MGRNKTGQHKACTPKQLANLKTFGKTGDPEWEHEQRAKGARAANAKKSERTTFKKAVQWLMDLEAFDTENEAIEKLREQFPTLTNAQAMAASVMRKAIIDGDAKAFQTIRDTSGETPAALLDVGGGEPMVISIKTVE